MIPHDYIAEWRANAPCVQDLQVEQDLVISRALVALFSQKPVARLLAFRGGTALYKLNNRAWAGRTRVRRGRKSQPLVRREVS